MDASYGVPFRAVSCRYITPRAVPCRQVGARRRSPNRNSFNLRFIPCRRQNRWQSLGITSKIGCI